MARWSIPLASLVRKTNNELDRIYRRAAMDLFYAVALPSPVKTGRFRANWNVAYAAPDLSTSTSTDSSRLHREIAKVKSLPADGTIYLTNNLVYAIKLEYGHSAQAPNGMVRLGIALWPTILRNAVRG